MKTVDIALGEKTYKVPKFTVGDLEHLMHVFKLSMPERIAAEVLRTAFVSAELVTDDQFRKLRVGIEEMRAAADQVLTFNGFQKAGGQGGGAGGELTLEDFLIDLFGSLAEGCGYTPAQIRALRFDDVERQFAYWGRHPPLRAMFAAVHGIKPAERKPAEKPSYMTADDMRRLMAMTGGRIPGM